MPEYSRRIYPHTRRPRERPISTLPPLTWAEFELMLRPTKKRRVESFTPRRLDAMLAIAGWGPNWFRTIRRGKGNRKCLNSKRILGLQVRDLEEKRVWLPADAWDYVMFWVERTRAQHTFFTTTREERMATGTDWLFCLRDGRPVVPRKLVFALRGRALRTIGRPVNASVVGQLVDPWRSIRELYCMEEVKATRRIQAAWMRKGF